MARQIHGKNRKIIHEGGLPLSQVGKNRIEKSLILPWPWNCVELPFCL